MTDLPESRTRNMEARRRRIMTEAGALMAAGGADCLTLRTLAERAGVTVPTIYNLVGAKDQLVATLVADALDRIDQHVAALPHRRGIARAQEAVRANLALCFGEPVRYAALYRALPDSRGPCSPLGPLFSRAGTVFCTALLEAHKDGDLHGRLLPVPLSHHILHGQIETFRLWALGALTDKATEARAFYVLGAGLMADATKQGRRGLLETLRPYEAALDT